MAKEIIYLTAEGYKKLKDELDHMRSVERPAISAAIAEARDKGDLSENAEYDAAREAQGLLEMRIAKLEDSLANARVIDESKIDKSKVLLNIAECGNMSATSVMVLLDEYAKKGTFHCGDKLLLVAFGGGLTSGAVIIEWKKN